MKRILYFTLFPAIIFCMFFTVPAYALSLPGPDELQLSAPCAVLMEKETGQIIYEKEPDRAVPPASITKIMTMLLIVEDIEAGRLRTDDTVSVSRRAASFGGSCVYLEEGERMSVHDMLKCIAVVSANDCAVAMAEHMSGTEQLFVARMNSRAKELGLKDSHFTNCTGLFDDPEHYTTARDVALLSRELIGHDMIKDYSSIWMDSIRDGEFQLSNTNKLVARYEGCTGLKTGYTSAARYCLSATAERDGMEFIAVVMGCRDPELRNSDAAALLNYGFAHFSLCSLRPEEPLPELIVELGREKGLRLYYDAPEYALITKGASEPEYSLALPASVPAPVKKGQQLGELIIRLGDSAPASVPIRAADDVPRLGFLGMLGLLGSGLFGL